MSKINLEQKFFFSDFGIYFFRVVTGGWVAVVIAHFFQVFFDLKLFPLFLIVFLITGIIVYATKKRGFFFMIIFNLFFILVGVLFKMYIEMAQNQISNVSSNKSFHHRIVFFNSVQFTPLQIDSQKIFFHHALNKIEKSCIRKVKKFIGQNSKLLIFI